MLQSIPTPALPQVCPVLPRSGASACASPAPHAPLLPALRQDIDRLDDELLKVFERRLSVASRIGQAKVHLGAPTLRLRPAREQAILARLLGRTRPDDRAAVEGLWREIMGWGRGRQEPLRVQVWAPVEPARIFDAARLRFGAAAEISAASDPEAALAWADARGGVAVLAVNAESAWWIGLRRQWSTLAVVGGFGGAVPSALGVGRVEEAALVRGRRVIVNAGGDAGDGGGRNRQGLATHHGWTLSLTDGDVPLHGPEGCVGSVD